MRVRSAGRFYEFHGERIVSRAGQPIKAQAGMEIGAESSGEAAARQVREGMDVYTPGKQDAYKLAAKLHAFRPVEHGAENEFYYSHFHPGGIPHQYDPARSGRLRAMVGPGHVFFGDRGQGLRLK